MIFRITAKSSRGTEIISRRVAEVVMRVERVVERRGAKVKILVHFFFEAFTFHSSEAESFEVQFPDVLEAPIEVCPAEYPDRVVDEGSRVCPEGFDQLGSMDRGLGEIHAGCWRSLDSCRWEERKPGGGLVGR